MPAPDLADTSFVVRSPEMERTVRTAQQLARGWRGLLILGGRGSGKRRLAGLTLQASARLGEKLLWFDCAAPAGELVRWFDLLAEPNHIVRSLPVTVVLDRIDCLSAEGCDRFVARMWMSPYMLSPHVRVIATSRHRRETLADVGDGFVDLLAHLDLGDLRVPSLRRRGPDLPALVRILLTSICEEHGIPRMRPTIAVVDALRAYDWPGNVVELEEVLRWAVLVANDHEQEVIRHEDLPAAVRGEDDDDHDVDGDDQENGIDTATDGSIGTTLAERERQQILAAEKRFGGDRRAMAEALGISVNTVWRRMRKYGRVREYHRTEATPRSRHTARSNS
jgi:DNA-binding NtrC family response regulator